MGLFGFFGLLSVLPFCAALLCDGGSWLRHVPPCCVGMDVFHHVGPSDQDFVGGIGHYGGISGGGIRRMV